VLEQFIDETEPAQFDAREWRARLLNKADGLLEARKHQAASG
jgi:hypothetical protein